MENKPYGVIYKITNLINEKVYIGRTKQKLYQRWSSHKCYSKKEHVTMNISKAIKKYGEENFTIVKIDTANSHEELILMEERYINKYTSYDNKFGYNIERTDNGKKYFTKTKLLEHTKFVQSEKMREISRINGLKGRGRKVSKDNKYIGVTPTKSSNYRCILGYNNKNINLGTYTLESDAAKAYDIKAIELYGNDCILNFPELREKYINKEITVYKNKRSKSGIKGLSFLERGQYWQASFYKNSKRIYSRHFKNKDDAIKQLIEWSPTNSLEYF